MAEFRYGREEMLALFDKNIKMASGLKEFVGLATDKCQQPLAFEPMSEEEHRLWSRSINSEAMIRLTKGSNVMERDNRDQRDVRIERGSIERNTGPGGSLRMRGGLTGEKGRGRGRGYYQRGVSYDEGEDGGNENRADFRKNYDRSSSTANEDGQREKSYDRSYTRTESTEEMVRPRKDLRSVENWRSGGRSEDRDRNWRARGRNEETWGRNHDSWRSDERDVNEENRSQLPPRGYTRRHKSKIASENWEEREDGEEERRACLPEWSLDDGPISESKVGTFDASGAFREGSPNEENKEKIQCSSSVVETSDNRRNLTDQKNSNKLIDDVNSEVKEISSIHDSHGKDEAKVEINQNPIPKSVITNVVPDHHSTTSKINEAHLMLIKTNQKAETYQASPKASTEEDGLSHLEKAAENMVAQWTAEEDQKERQSNVASNNKLIVVPLNHEDAYKWFYRDPQGEVQGPFSSQEMYEWFASGYFSIDLLVRRGCDERFSQLGELAKIWERVPFIQGKNPPPIRSAPFSQNVNLFNSEPINMNPQAMQPNTTQIQMRQRQMVHQEQMQRQFYLNQQLLMQTQLRQLLEQLKKQEGFINLSQQEQQEALVQHFVTNQQVEPRPINQIAPNIPEEPNSVIEQLARMGVPMIRSGPMATQQQNVPSIWDVNGGVITASALEEMHRQERKKLEMMEAEKQKKLMEVEQMKVQRAQAEAEAQRKYEEERLIEEMQRKIKEEYKLKEELLKEQEERKRKEEEEKRLEQERLALEKEKLLLEEQRIMEEQRRRQEEIMRLEEMAKKQKEEAERQKRAREAEEAERLRNQQIQQEIEFRKKIREENIRKQAEQEEALRRTQEQKKVWGQSYPKSSTLSLAEIQRLQEEKDREEKIKQMQVERQMQAIYESQQLHQQQQLQQRQQQQQQQHLKNQLTWANSNKPQAAAPIKTLAEIQIEEAERMNKKKPMEEKKSSQTTVTNAGIWSNATSQLSWKGPGWSNSNVGSGGGGGGGGIGSVSGAGTASSVGSAVSVGATAATGSASNNESFSSNLWDNEMTGNLKNSNIKSNESALPSNKVNAANSVAVKSHSNTRTRKDEVR